MHERAAELGGRCEVGPRPGGGAQVRAWLPADAGQLQVVNIWNPISHLIKAMRALMVGSYDWARIGKSFLSLAVLGALLHGATLWAFRRLTAGAHRPCGSVHEPRRRFPRDCSL